MIQKKTRQQLMNDLASKFDRAQQDFRARNTQLQQAAAQRPSPQIAPVRRPARLTFGAQQKPIEAPVNRVPGISVGVPGTPTFREQPMAAPNKVSPAGPLTPNPYITYRGNGMASMAPPPSEARRRIDDEVNRITDNGTRPFPGGTEGFLKFIKEQEMRQASPPFVDNMPKLPPPNLSPDFSRSDMGPGSGGAPRIDETFKADLGFPDRPFGISVGVPGTPTYKERIMTPPGDRVEMPQGPLGISVGVPGTPTYREQPLTMAAKGPAPAFKKGGKVKAKAAPIKKAAGGKVAVKAPVKKAVGGKVAAKPIAKPIAKKAKPMAKPMSAMKRGGKVMMKGKYK